MTDRQTLAIILAVGLADGLVKKGVFCGIAAKNSPVSQRGMVAVVNSRRGQAV